MGFSPPFLYTALLCIDFILSGYIHCRDKIIIQQFQAYIQVDIGSAGKRERLYASSTNRSLVTTSLGLIGSHSHLEPMSVAMAAGCYDWSGLSHIPFSEMGDKFRERLLHRAHRGDWNGRESISQEKMRLSPTRQEANGLCTAIK